MQLEHHLRYTALTRIYARLTASISVELQSYIETLEACGPYDHKPDGSEWGYCMREANLKILRPILSKLNTVSTMEHLMLSVLRMQASLHGEYDQQSTGAFMNAFLLPPGRGQVIDPSNL